jgi:hypothetical protein
MIKLTKKPLNFLMESLQFLIPGKVWGILQGVVWMPVLPFTCYSYWFSCYFDQRGKLMKALVAHEQIERFFVTSNTSKHFDQTQQSSSVD